MSLDVPDDLVDAVARGRLALAELAGMTERELDALYMLAVARLDAQRVHEAKTLLAGLLTLFPYRAAYWRAYGIALQRSRLYVEAKQAYDAALLLEPGHSAATCHRGEVSLYLGDEAAARIDLQAALTATDPTIARRAKDLLGLLDRVTPTPMPPTLTTRATEDTTTFVLRDATPLPLTESRFDEREPAEVTQTTITLTAIALHEPIREVTETAVIPGRRRRPSEAHDEPRRETTHTAIVRRHHGGRFDEEA